jgi:hypothetical protein
VAPARYWAVASSTERRAAATASLSSTTVSWAPRKLAIPSSTSCCAPRTVFWYVKIACWKTASWARTWFVIWP